MLKTLCLPFLLCCGLACLAPAPVACDSSENRKPKTENLQLRDGDRVVLIGSTLIEREQRYGYWETALTRRHPHKSITFRNLGWSGDTVFGDARAGFGTQADGFRHLKEHVLALKPTVIIIGYGTNESFEGRKGLPHFVKGLETLLDTFAPTKARIVLLSPLRQEKIASPLWEGSSICPTLPDPAQNNKSLRLYADAIGDVAKRRGHVFVDLNQLLGEETAPLTGNGIHLTAWGYWRSAIVLERALCQPATQARDSQRARIMKSDNDPRRIQVTLQMLPWPPPPIEGKPCDFACVDLQGERQREFLLRNDPDLAQAEKLRQIIVAKNRLYFYRWRPENETYLFGFRKHEQGQNAREIPQFDPLIAAEEKEIAKLRVPLPHTYELKGEKKP